MKCVCPMGGDRTCPDDCPLAVWASLSQTDRKAQRKAIAEKLYKQGFTMEQIATQLGVGFSTIQRDLESNLPTTGKSKPGKSARNPKGAGRPKGGGKRKPGKKPGEKQAQRSVNANPDDWERFKKKAEAEGKSAADKLGDIIREPEIDPTTLSMSAQQKVETAIRQQTRRLEAAFGERVRAEAQNLIEETILPQYNKERDLYRKVIKFRNGIMDRASYRKISRCLHPDWMPDDDKKKDNAEAFNLFRKSEDLLIGEREHPLTNTVGFPKTAADLQAMRRKKAG